MPADLREVNKEEDWRLSLLILAQTAKQHVLFHKNLAPFDSSLKKKKIKKKKIGDWFGRVIPLETQPSSRLKVSLLKDICLQSYYYNARITFKSGREEMISVQRGWVYFFSLSAVWSTNSPIVFFYRQLTSRFCLRQIISPFADGWNYVGKASIAWFFF